MSKDLIYFNIIQALEKRNFDNARSLIELLEHEEEHFHGEKDSDIARTQSSDEGQSVLDEIF